MTVPTDSIAKLARVSTTRTTLAKDIDEGMTSEELNSLPISFQVAIMLVCEAETQLLRMLASIAEEHTP